MKLKRRVVCLALFNAGIAAAASVGLCGVSAKFGYGLLQFAVLITAFVPPIWLFVSGLQKIECGCAEIEENSGVKEQRSAYVAAYVVCVLGLLLLAATLLSPPRSPSPAPPAPAGDFI